MMISSVHWSYASKWLKHAYCHTPILEHNMAMLPKGAVLDNMKPTFIISKNPSQIKYNKKFNSIINQVIKSRLVQSI